MPALDAAADARLQHVLDAEEIRSLLTTYAEELDRKDFAAYAELFAEDGELVAPLGQARGREEIRALLTRRLAPNAERPSEPSFHVVSNPTIRIDGDRATSKVIWMYITRNEAGYPIILQLGLYDDVLTREHGRWRFQRRTITRELGFSPVE